MSRLKMKVDNQKNYMEILLQREKFSGKINALGFKINCMSILT